MGGMLNYSIHTWDQAASRKTERRLRMEAEAQAYADELHAKREKTNAEFLRKERNKAVMGPKQSRWK